MGEIEAGGKDPWKQKEKGSVQKVLQKEMT